MVILVSVFAIVVLCVETLVLFWMKRSFVKQKLVCAPLQQRSLVHLLFTILVIIGFGILSVRNFPILFIGMLVLLGIQSILTYSTIRKYLNLDPDQISHKSISPDKAGLWLPYREYLMNIEVLLKEMVQDNQRFHHAVFEITQSHQSYSKSAESLNHLVVSINHPRNLSVLSDGNAPEKDLADQYRKVIQGAQDIQANQKEIAAKVAAINEMVRNASNNSEISTFIYQDIKNLFTNIDSINKIIDSITEQSNVLSLNAAIEAASSNQAGLGFNVVSNNLRTLSSKIKEQTNEIRSVLALIKNDLSTGFNSMNKIKNFFYDLDEEINDIDSSLAKNSETLHQYLDKSMTGDTQSGDNSALPAAAVIHQDIEKAIELWNQNEPLAAQQNLIFQEILTALNNYHQEKNNIVSEMNQLVKEAVSEAEQFFLKV